MRAAGQRVLIGRPDPTVMANGGLVAITELADHLGVSTAAWMPGSNPG